MKFVRTKSGRILTPIGYDSRVGDIYDGDELKNDEVVDTFDSIDDLCDRFVVEYTSGEHTTFRYFFDLQRHYRLYNRDYHHVAGRYGAIWVAGKGLIYVAKMNKNGELELI